MFKWLCLLSLLTTLTLWGAAAKKSKLGGSEKGEMAYPIQSESYTDDWKKVAVIDKGLVKAAAARLDKIVEMSYAQKKLTPLAIASDSVFIRRVFLDIAGRIPAPKELDEFLGSTNPNKREELIYKLLDSEAYVAHNYNYWAGLLRINNAKYGLPDDAYPNWIKNAFRDNMPYDVFATRLVTADGAATEDNGAVGFVLRDIKQGTLDHVSQIATIFLSSQIGCAMCHDAKFEKWKQTNFYALSAYFSEISMAQEAEARKELAAEKKKINSDPKAVRALKSENKAIPFVISDRQGKEITLPADYKYDENLRGKVVEPNVLYGQTPTQESSESRRRTFAKWMTSPENPNFTRSIANRMWQRMFGIGLIEPVDDLNDDNLPSSPELMTEITKIMIELKYNLKAFNAVIALTKIYQRETSPKAVSVQDFDFTSHPLRRLSSEQLYDSLITLYAGDKISEQKAYESKLGDPRVKDSEATGKASEEMAMTEEPKTKKGKTDPGVPMPNAKALQAIKAEYRTQLKEETKTLGFTPSASLLGVPTPGGFLDQFGAPGRDIVSTGTLEPNISQTLLLMNGSELAKITRGDTDNALITSLAKFSSYEELLKRAVYLILGRSAKPSELEIFVSYAKEVMGETVPKSGPKTEKITKEKLVSDLVWSLLNGREFLFER